MRLILSWLLLLIITCHWLGSFVGFKVVYTVEVESEMNAIEQMIAELVKAETNLDAHITIIPSDQVALRGNGYGNLFVFSKEINGETIHYKIDPAPRKYFAHEYLSNNLSGSDSQQKVALLDQLFSKYTIPKPTIPITSQNDATVSPSFGQKLMRDFRFRQVLTPPPDFSFNI